MTAASSAWADDGQKALYTSATLQVPAPGSQWELQPGPNDNGVLKISLFPKTKREVTVILKHPKQLYYNDFTRSGTRQELAPLDVAMRPINLKGIGAAYFDETMQRRWALKYPLRPPPAFSEYEMFMGYKQSIVMTKKGAMLQLDRAACVMHTTSNLLEFIANKLGKRDTRDLRLEDCARGTRAPPDRVLDVPSALSDGRTFAPCVGAASRELSKSNRKWKVISSHTPWRPKKLQKLDNLRADQSMFELDRGDGPKTISVYEYFSKPKSEGGLGIRIERPDLPCVCVGPQGTAQPILPPNPSERSFGWCACACVAPRACLAQRTPKRFASHWSSSPSRPSSPSARTPRRSSRPA